MIDKGKSGLDHNNLEDYADPLLYDQENGDFEPDGPFYLALAGRLGGQVLELGCGTGRITIPLAQAGIEVTGLDIVPEMLERAKSKAADLPIEWVQADVRDFHLGGQFSLICAPGCVFEHLVARGDQEAMLACVREHLLPEGRFVLATRFPHPQMMVTDDQETDWFSYTDESGRAVRVSGMDAYDPLRQIRHETAFRRWQDENGDEVTRRARLSLRLIFPQEMEALLYYNGFKVLERFGDWVSSPLAAESRSMIYVCEGS